MPRLLIDHSIDTENGEEPYTCPKCGYVESEFHGRTGVTLESKPQTVSFDVYRGSSYVGTLVGPTVPSKFDRMIFDGSEHEVIMVRREYKLDHDQQCLGQSSVTVHVNHVRNL